MENSDTLKVEDVVNAEIIKITEFGAFVKFGNKKGLIHISQVSDSYVKKVEDHLKIGDKVTAKIIKISPDGKIDLTLKNGKDQAPRPPREHVRRGARQDASYRENMSSSPNGKSFRTSSFEDKLKHFLEESNERQAALQKYVEKKQGR